ncbi:hypothetical protein KP509_38G037900 [Ceratopteris richardii]|uniref:Uncharacterized protein n=1 Tax=Ceratopteris richardii TaxID=49495 RepID=A0A8T2Q3P5_CERRI|nr:hypothetical protein KP509_38G037900 [Ceratopteris richardii]
MHWLQSLLGQVDYSILIGNLGHAIGNLGHAIGNLVNYSIVIGNLGHAIASLSLFTLLHCRLHALATISPCPSALLISNMLAPPLCLVHKLRLQFGPLLG